MLVHHTARAHPPRAAPLQPLQVRCNLTTIHYASILLISQRQFEARRITGAPVDQVIDAATDKARNAEIGPMQMGLVKDKFGDRNAQSAAISPIAPGFALLSGCPLSASRRFSRSCTRCLRRPPWQAFAYARSYRLDLRIFPISESTAPQLKKSAMLMRPGFCR